MRSDRYASEAVAVGKRYGMRVVIAEAGRKGNCRMVRVRCDCGAEHVVAAPDLKRGVARACRPCAMRAQGVRRKGSKYAV